MESTGEHTPEWQAAFALGWSQLWQDQRFCLRRSKIEDFYWDLCVTAITQQLSKWQKQNSAFFFFSWQHFLCSSDPKKIILTLTLLTVNNFSFLYRGNACWNLLCGMLATESSSHLRTGKVNCLFCICV